MYYIYAFGYECLSQISPKEIIQASVSIITEL